MASKPPKQDLPRAGGYGPINWKRNIPQRGFSGSTMFAGAFGFMAFGWYMLIIQQRQARLNRWEQLEAKYSIMAFLQAEQDREVLRRMKHNEEVEAAIMADVPGWVPGASVMHDGKRWNGVTEQELYYDFAAEQPKEKWWAFLFR